MKLRPSTDAYPNRSLGNGLNTSISAAIKPPATREIVDRAALTAQPYERVQHEGLPAARLTRLWTSSGRSGTGLSATSSSRSSPSSIGRSCSVPPAGVNPSSTTRRSTTIDQPGRCSHAHGQSCQQGIGHAVGPLCVLHDEGHVIVDGPIQQPHDGGGSLIGEEPGLDGVDLRGRRGSDVRHGADEREQRDQAGSMRATEAASCALIVA